VSRISSSLTWPHALSSSGLLTPGHWFHSGTGRGHQSWTVHSRTPRFCASYSKSMFPEDPGSLSQTHTAHGAEDPGSLSQTHTAHGAEISGLLPLGAGEVLLCTQNQAVPSVCFTTACGESEFCGVRATFVTQQGIKGLGTLGHGLQGVWQVGRAVGQEQSGQGNKAVGLEVAQAPAGHTLCRCCLIK
jgi:hypothetical protein